MQLPTVLETAAARLIVEADPAEAAAASAAIAVAVKINLFLEIQ